MYLVTYFLQVYFEYIFTLIFWYYIKCLFVGMDQMKIEGDPIDTASVANRGAWDMPYSGTFNPNSSPMPFNYPGEPPRYMFDKDESGSGNFCTIIFTLY